MENPEYITTLEEARRWAREHPGMTYEGDMRAKVLSAFDALVASGPTEAHFAAVMGGVFFLPEMLYRLTLGPRWRTLTAAAPEGAP